MLPVVKETSNRAAEARDLFLVDLCVVTVPRGDMARSAPSLGLRIEGAGRVVSYSRQVSEVKGGEQGDDLEAVP